MFCWRCYSHITRIARCPLLGPAGLVPENERRSSGRDSKERMGGGGVGGYGAGKPAKKQLCGKMTDSAGLFAELEEGKMRDWLWDCMKIGIIRP